MTAAHIAAVVSRQSGVPAEKLTAAQTATLAAMEQTLSGRVVGQPDAVRAVAGALQRASLGLPARRAPMGSVFVPWAHRRGKNSWPGRWRIAALAVKRRFCALI